MSMEKKDLFIAGIFYTAVLALLLASFNALLSAKIDPLEKNQVRMETRMDRMETRMDRIESKLDKLLSIKTTSSK